MRLRTEKVSFDFEMQQKIINQKGKTKKKTKKENKERKGNEVLEYYRV